MKRNKGLLILGISLASLNALLWLCVPAIRAFIDQQTGRWADPNNPQIITGVQEMSISDLTTFSSTKKRLTVLRFAAKV